MLAILMGMCYPFSSFWLILVLITVPGILGGLITAVSIYLKAIDVEASKWPPRGHLSARTFFVSHAATGFGGAVAALLVLLWANRIEEKNVLTPIPMLTLSASGFVAGYIANRLLPAIADSFYNKLARLTEETQNNKEKLADAQNAIEQATQTAAENQSKLNQTTQDLQDQLAKAHSAIDEAQRKTLQAVQLASELVSANAYLRAKDFSQAQTDKSSAVLESLVVAFPRNRTLNILLARMYDEALANRSEAIAKLRDFIKAKQAANEGTDLDTAAAYWNIANYHEFDFKKTKLQADRDQALAAVTQAVSLQPVPFLKKFEEDADLKELREATEGQNLLKNAKLRQQANPLPQHS